MSNNNETRKEVGKAAMTIIVAALLGIALMLIMFRGLMYGTNLPFSEQRDYWRWYAAGSNAMVAIFEIVTTICIIAGFVAKEKNVYDYRKKGSCEVATIAFPLCLGLDAVVAIICAATGYISYFPWTEQKAVFKLYFLSLFNSTMLVAMLCFVAGLTVKLIKDKKRKG